MKIFLSNKVLVRTVGILLLIIIGINVLEGVIQGIQEKKINKKIQDLANNSLELSPEDYLALRDKKVFGEKVRHANTQNFSGVYVLHNKTKDLYYVGQSIKVLDRIGNHFRGNGNGDVYADYKYGDTFVIRTMALEGSSFNTLNDLERHAIQTFGAYEKGYNRNRGNKK